MTKSQRLMAEAWSMMQIDNNSYHVPRHVTFWDRGFSNTGDTRPVTSDELRVAVRAASPVLEYREGTAEPAKSDHQT
jgi:hypothetical protein